MRFQKKYFLSFILLSAVLMAFFSFGAFASEGKNRLIDNAGLLTSSETENLSSKLDEISEREKIDIVILTEKSLDGKSPEAYADDYFDYNNYGIGEDKSGVLLLLDMSGRNMHISTKGYAIKVFTDAGLKYIEDKLSPDLKSKNYNEAFETFISNCSEFITKAKTDKPYDGSTLPKEPFNVSFWVPVSIVAGVILSWLVMSYMKNQLKTVVSKSKADDYIQEGSLQIKDSRDIFLYSSVVRRARPKASSGSSTHRSSSGSIHGGRTSKF